MPTRRIRVDITQDVQDDRGSSGSSKVESDMYDIEAR